MTIPVVDYHCDVLSKMVKDKSISFVDDPMLDVTYKRLLEGGVALQTFAIFCLRNGGFPALSIYWIRSTCLPPASFPCRKASGG